MRYRTFTHRYWEIVRRTPGRLGGDPWSPVRSVSLPEWRPASDVCETAEGLVATIDLAGVPDDSIEILLYPDALVVAGRRRCTCPSDSRFHVAEIRYGPFRWEMPIPAEVDRERVTAAMDRGFLRLQLPRRTEEPT